MSDAEAIAYMDRIARESAEDGLWKEYNDPRSPLYRFGDPRVHGGLVALAYLGAARQITAR